MIWCCFLSNLSQLPASCRGQMRLCVGLSSPELIFSSSGFFCNTLTCSSRVSRSSIRQSLNLWKHICYRTNQYKYFLFRKMYFILLKTGSHMSFYWVNLFICLLTRFVTNDTNKVLPSIGKSHIKLYTTGWMCRFNVCRSDKPQAF